MKLFLDASVLLAACGRLKPSLEVMTDVVTFDWAVVFPAAKDRPVLFTAAATSDVLLTLDARISEA